MSTKKSQENATFSDLVTITKYKGSQKEATMIETSKLVDSILPFKDAEDLNHISEARLVSEYSSPVYRFCLSLVYRREDADDLFQDTYLQAFSKISKITASENPLGYLLSIAASLWKSRQRKYARRNRLAPETELDDALSGDTTSLEDSAIANEEIQIVRKLVSALPIKLRVPVVMYYTIEMSISDIAITLKLPVGTVKSHLSRARGIIKKGLVEEYGNG